MSERNERINNNSNSACIVCYKNVKYYSIGMCEHPVCYECSTRMRVLCQQNECPICRQDLPKVVFTKEVKPFRLLKKGTLFDNKFNIFFETQEIQNDFNKLLAHECNICDRTQVFNSFTSLKDHMKRKHDLHYCDLCVENVKIFSHERRCYTKADLSLHRRKGDVDDKSHKGHPICEFCDKRYMDTDELYRHLRRDHLFCHFCDADGLHHYYSSYDYLREHFQKEHYLCEEGGCADEQFTSVFRTDIDLKAHKSSVHGKQLGKVAAKQARTLELEFTLTPRVDFRNRRGGGQAGASRNPRDEAGASYQRHHHNSREEGGSNYPRNPHIYQRPETPPPVEEPVFVQQPLCDVQSTQEFPTLGNAPTRPVVGGVSGPGRSRGNLTIRGVLKNNYNENFPALGPDGTAPMPPPSTKSSTLTKSFNVSVSSSKPSSSAAAAKPKPAPNASNQANHRANGPVMTRLSSGPSLRINTIPSSSREMDFPALSRAVVEAAAAPVSTANPSTWTKVTCVKPDAMPPKSKKVAPPPLAAAPPPIRSGEDFPSLSKPSKPTNKASPAPTKPSAPAGPSWMQSTDTSSSSSTAADPTKG
ncbi:E3 ubiquitin-protein ligase ZNF598, partial [Copidosoma floridanum]|uniref:E3 ubiquitin-protein ligase ZNF598 n=1 Tax=Copidosoma floridanum TaxID=29053 RepID=UPI0006C93D7D